MAYRWLHLSGFSFFSPLCSMGYPSCNPLSDGLVNYLLCCLPKSRLDGMVLSLVRNVDVHT